MGINIKPSSESRVDLGAGSPDAGEVGYYPEGPPKKLSAAEERIAEDISDLGPYLEGNYLAQLGLEVVPPERIVELEKRYNVAGFYSPQDISRTGRDPFKRVAVLEMLRQGRDARKLYGDPGVRKNVLAYSYPDVSSGRGFVEPFDKKVGNRFQPPGEEFPPPTLEEFLDRDLTREEARSKALGTLVHELVHAGDIALTRNLQVDDDVGFPNIASRQLGENYTRLVDIMNRDRGLGILQSPVARELEGRAVAKGIGRYFRDPFETRVLKSGFFNRRERLDPEEFEKAVLSHPAQEAARRELLRRKAARTPTGGYSEGGEVEEMPNEPRVSSLPYEDRTAIGQFLEDYGPFSALLRLFGTRYPDPVPERLDLLNQLGNPKALTYGGGTVQTKSALDSPEEGGSKVDLGAGGPSEEGLGYADGGGVGIGKSVTLSKVVPYVDPRSAALGSRLLKQAGVPGDFSSLMQRADPKVVSQVNRIMARGPTKEISSPANGLGVFMQSVMKQG